ncbi:hypothetical protein PsorP6_000702 [Peronosclerospora sorghi]|uniref:Uncharacterized protein n=1 Tax=Peronosclerospora sorghi TaxID=230839 RepID=A0ACC0WYF1_9STRA|nr:hypothetical protein PsorP6_000702 [Peronosclerospora sorghi]
MKRTGIRPVRSRMRRRHGACMTCTRGFRVAPGRRRASTVGVKRSRSTIATRWCQRSRRASRLARAGVALGHLVLVQCNHGRSARKVFVLERLWTLRCVWHDSRVKWLRVTPGGHAVLSPPPPGIDTCATGGAGRGPLDDRTRRGNDNNRVDATRSRAGEARVRTSVRCVDESGGTRLLLLLLLPPFLPTWSVFGRRNLFVVIEWFQQLKNCRGCGVKLP